MLQDRDHRPPATLQELKYLIAKRQIIFPNGLEQVARLMLEQPEMIAFGSAAAIARRCSVSQTTVHRLAQHIGFRTFAELRAMVREHLRSSATHSRGPVLKSPA
ncbi:transcriptional regulator [Rhizobium sp. R72]|uniref:MurR/RpiR family transcriptional regulator n=1 Tax=unclassified Rhizobium TaxID=2613769 RepID=UPI000B534A31|nr:MULTISPECIES: MurR/RpiR family transcriptional regulator [unclassified Rhizobium]OWV98116.1 transcriptional regulator [Rhizobium sp. R72]OWV98141.1 transcriptional regulator [Rhizobium sp. R711]